MQLVGVHMLAAKLTKQDILIIQKDEGEALAKALVDITAHYGLTASRSVMLWIQLGGTAAMIYGPKFMTVMEQKKRNKPAPTQTPVAPGNGAVLNFGNE